MLRASPLVSSAAHPRPLSASPSPPNSFKPRVLDITGVSNPLKNPRLRPLASRSRSTPRALRLVCRADHLEDAGSKIRAPSEEESMAEVEGDWARRDAAEGGGLNVGVGNPSLPACLRMHRVSLGDQAFFLLAFIACTTSIAFTSLVIAAVPTLYAMKKAATSLAKLADTAREELPSTMAAIRLSGMEISDLTLELSDLSQEIADGVNKSAQAVQAAEAGIRQFGASARRHTVSLIQERASLPNISLQPVVAGAAKRTSRAVGQATKSFINLLSRGHHSSEIEEGSNKVDC